MEDIRQWFNSSKDYNAGAALYLKYGKDLSKKKIFQQAETPFKYELLLKELESILNPDATPPPSEPDIKTESAPEHADQNKWPEKMDPVLTALKLKWQPLFSEMISLCNRVGDMAKEGLTDSSKKDEAGRMALRILELDDLCDAIYKDRSFYQQHGALPVKEAYPVEIAVDPAKWPLRLSNHQRYIRDYKAKLAKNPSSASVAATLKKHEWAVDQYKKLLKID